MTTKIFWQKGGTIFFFVVFLFTIFAWPTHALEVTSFNQNLSLGIRSSEVSRLQQFLVPFGFLTEDSVTGYFGPKTLAAVKQFQSLSNVTPVSGFFGPLTRAKANISIGPESLPTPEYESYPYILGKLPSSQLSTLRSEFSASNPKICDQINEFGFTEAKSLCYGEILNTVIADQEASVEGAKNWLVQNSKFTGVLGKSDLIVDSITRINEQKVTRLLIYFHEQTYSGLPVVGDVNKLTVEVNTKGVSSILGNRFPIIVVPLEPKVSEVSVRNKLIGRTFTYSDVGGGIRNYVVLQSDLNIIGTKVIYVKKTSLGLEFHLAWKIPVGQGMSWVVYVDAITGEELKAVQEFVT